MSEFYYTGVSATTEEEAAFRLASFDPLAARFGPSRRKSQLELIAEAAIAHGLPEGGGPYGYDFSRREFIR